MAGFCTENHSPALSTNIVFIAFTITEKSIFLKIKIILKKTNKQKPNKQTDRTEKYNIQKTKPWLNI